MENTTNRVPVNLIYLGKNEMLAVALVAGAVIGVSYQVGKEAQRRWLDKRSLIVVKK
jgi:hypothetical protein